MSNVIVFFLLCFTTSGRQRLLIGDENPALLIIQAENQGEGAYEAELHVHLPAKTHYQAVLSNREVRASTLTLHMNQNQNEMYSPLCVLFVSRHQQNHIHTHT